MKYPAPVGFRQLDCSSTLERANIRALLIFLFDIHGLRCMFKQHIYAGEGIATTLDIVFSFTGTLALLAVDYGTLLLIMCCHLKKPLRLPCLLCCACYKAISTRRIFPAWPHFYIRAQKHLCPSCICIWCARAPLYVQTTLTCWCRHGQCAQDCFSFTETLAFLAADCGTSVWP